jgi:hypothetical protein
MYKVSNSDTPDLMAELTDNLHSNLLKGVEKG